MRTYGHRPQPTLETVAAEAGVSRATVSRVINGSPKVSAQVKEAVEVAITRLGYVPNRAARTLVTRHTDSIALVMREPAAFGLADPYLSSMVIAASQVLSASGLQLVLMMAQAGPDHGKLADYARSGHVDGVILMSMHGGDPLPGVLLRAGVPTVVGGRLPGPLSGMSYVDVDNVDGARQAVRHLLGSGRRRIATIGGPLDMTAAADRLAGFREMLGEAGVAADLVEHGDFTRASGEAATHRLLERDPGLDAVFAANDLMAIGALGALRATGRRSPDDVAVVGFDDIELAAHTDPPLTTVHQPVPLQARTIVEMLRAQMATGEVGEPVVLPTELVVRASG